MEAVFLKLVNMSLTASWLVLAIIVLRLALKKAPRWMLCALWGLVALRLVCPFSIESALSLIPSSEPLPQEIIYTAAPEIQSGIAPIDNIVNPVLSETLTADGLTSANPTQVWSFILSHVWLMGMAAMLLYAAASYLLLRRRMATATLLRENIKQSGLVDSPFVLGILRPTIYLPHNMSEADMDHVIAHEQAHIKRHDHWWKPIGYLLLAVYWFNPMLWLAYVLLCRDIEAGCDEKVIADMEKDDRRAYSTALLNCSVHRRRIAACPLAFGEVGVKERVKSVMNYKKPAFWIIVVAVIASIVVAVCFLTDPAKDAQSHEPFGHTYRVEEVLYCAPQYSFTYTAETAPRYSLSTDCALSVAYDVLDSTESGSWVRAGSAVETELTKDNFDRYFWDESSVSGWHSGKSQSADLRKQNKAAWRIMVEDDPNNLFYYILQQQSGDIYLTYGYYDTEGETGPYSDDSSIRWLFKLTRSDLLACNAESQGINAFIEPTWYPDGVDWVYDDLNWGEAKGSGKLVFTVDWETEELAVTENYYESISFDEGTVDSQFHALTRNASGQFELEIAHRNPERSAQAIYYIRGETGVYIMRIQFATEAATGSPAGSTAVELSMIQALRDATMENSTLTRIEGNTEVDLARSGAAMDVLKSAAESLQVLEDPMEFDAHTGGTYLWLGDPGDRHISFFAGKEPCQVKIRYVGDDINESAETNNPQLYLFLMAAAEMENVELHDLDGDGLLEGIVWPFPMEQRNIIIYDVFDGALQRIDVNETMDCAASDFTGLIANIHPDYNCMIQIANDAGQVDVYQYHDGELSYACPLSDATGYAPPYATAALTAEEIEAFHEMFAPIVFDKQGNPIGTNPWTCFFTSYYSDVRELDFAEFMSYFPGDGSTVGGAEFAALKELYTFPFRGEVSTLVDMPVPVSKYPARLIDLVLNEYAGITTEDLDTSGVEYLAEYDAYYSYTSDFGPGTFTCTRGEVEGDLVRLYDEESPFGTDVLTLRKEGDSYRVVSNQRLES